MQLFPKVSEKLLPQNLLKCILRESDLFASQIRFSLQFLLKLYFHLILSGRFQSIYYK